MTEKQIAEGIPKIIENAKSVYTDADLLRINERYERAYSLFQLSIEEIAKAYILIGALIFEDLSSSEVQKRLKRELNYHELKLKKSIALESFFYQFIKEVNFEKYEELTIKSFKELVSINHINEKKNWGFYTSLYLNKFQSPSELIIEKDVNDIKTKARFRIFIGNKIIPVILQRYHLIKDMVRNLNFNLSESSQLNVEELISVRNKYGIG